jgi:hypothetical protein
MKNICLFIIAILVMANGAKAQQTGKIALTEPLTYKKHCAATQVGKVMMITGGAAAITGVVMLLSPYSKDNDQGHGEGYKTSEEVAIAGGSLTVIGGLVYLLGREEDTRNKRRFEVLSAKNKIGLVYHF